MNLQSLQKLSGTDGIEKYIDDTETFAVMPSTVADLDMEYKQIDEAITNTASNPNAFSIHPTGTTAMNQNIKLFILVYTNYISYRILDFNLLNAGLL